MNRRPVLWVLVVALSLVLGGCRTSPAPITPQPSLNLPSPSGTPLLVSSPAQTIIVTSTEDEGHGTLREALEDAIPGTTIIFDTDVFSPTDPVPIIVESPLPQITQGNLTIDASDAGVILDGSALPRDSWIPGLEIVSDANTIRGLQIVNFTGTGLVVAESGDNILGGDRSIGAGPTGQGNLTSGNDFGIGLWNVARENLVTGNVIGIDLNGVDPLGNTSAGVILTENAERNIIGPDNLIAYNGDCGIRVEGADSVGNTVTRNSIHDNGLLGICLAEGANAALPAPHLLSLSLAMADISGVTCPNCTVEFFSDDHGQGATYEGGTVADENGLFSYSGGATLPSLDITATGTAPDGSTSMFSRPGGSFPGSRTLQTGNPTPKFRLLAYPSGQLPADVRLGGTLYGWLENDLPHLDSVALDLLDAGIKRIDTSLNEVEPPIVWEFSETEIPPEYDRFIDEMNANGVAVNYIIHFWDKEGHARGEELRAPRFSDQEQIDRFIEYVRFIVHHFRGRVDTFTIWSEPGNCGDGGIKCVPPDEFINMAAQVIPVIRDEDKNARVGMGPHVLFYARDQALEILGSEIIREFDVIEWHGRYDVTPDNEPFADYYYEYAELIDTMQQTAEANGFSGDYWSTEMTWCSHEYPSCLPPDRDYEIPDTDKVVAKYYTRAFVRHLGWDMGVSFGGLESVEMPYTWPAIRNLNTVMNGTMPAALPVTITSSAPLLQSYGFTLPSGEMLLALWSDGSAVEDDPGVASTVRFSGLANRRVTGLDVLYGFEQDLVTTADGGDLVIDDLLIRDYPIILRIASQ